MQLPHDITGVVLAGGRSTRLAPITHDTNKHLLPVGGEPLVLVALRQLVAAGVRNVLVVIDERHADRFLAVLRDGRHVGLRSLAYAWQPSAALGLPTAIGLAEHHVHTDKLVVACGDVLIEDTLAGALAAFATQPVGARLVGTRVADTAGYTPLTVHDGRVVAIGDKDRARHAPGPMDLGFYCYHRDVFARISGLQPSTRGETEIWDLNRQYVEEGMLTFTELSGWWADVGSSVDTYRAVDRRYAA